MKLTSEQKEQITRALGSPFGRLKATIDGVEVAFEVRSRGPLEFSIMPFIDGKFLGTWLITTLDETFGARLLRKRSKRLCSKKEVAAWRKLDKKRAAEMDAKRIETRDFFKKPSQLIRHLEREFERVEIQEASPCG